MKEYKSTIRFSLWQALEITKYTVIVAVVMAIYFYLIDMNEEGAGIEQLVATVPNMIVAMGCVYIFIFGMVNPFTFFQQQIVCGSTRKQAVVGMSLINIITAILQLFIAAVLLFICTKLLGLENSGVEKFSFFINAYLLACGLAMIVQPLVLRWGKVGYFVVFFSLYALFGGFMGYWSIAKGGISSMVETFSCNTLLTVILFAFMILANIPMFLFTRRYEIKL